MEDIRWQGRVLGFVIGEYPHPLTEEEILREIAGEKPTFAQRDGIERAIEEIVRSGLFRRCESLILLTNAGRRIAILEPEW